MQDVGSPMIAMRKQKYKLNLKLNLKNFRYPSLEIGQKT